MMLSAWKRDAKPSLDTQSWKVVPVDSRDGRARDYLVKGVFGAGYHVMLCDGASGGVWEERLSSEEILLRLKVVVWLKLCKLSVMANPVFNREHAIYHRGCGLHAWSVSQAILM